MKYEVYETMAKEITAENALDVCKNMLEQAKSDAVAYDAEIKKLTDEIADGKAKYNDLQVDYIRRFTTASAPDDGSKAPEEMTDEQADAEIENALKGA